MNRLRRFRLHFIVMPLVTLLSFFLALLWIVNDRKNCAVQLEIILMVLFGIYAVCFGVFCRKKQREMVKGIEDDEVIASSIEKIFDRFVLVDFEADTYRYLRGTQPEFGEIPRHGKYNEFKEYVLAMLVGESDRNMLSEQLRAENIQKNLTEGTDALRFGYHIRRDTVIWENINIICLERKQSKAVKVVFTRQDVTELRERELKNHMALKEAFQAAEDANQAKSDFLSRMSHDIRTPLNAIMGMTTIAKMHKNDIGRIEDCLNKIEISGKHLIRLVNEVLDMSKIESGRVSLLEEPFSLDELIESISTIMNPQAMEKHIDLQFSLHQIAHKNLIGDIQRIEQIVINILGNAIKFTPENGVVAVCLTEKESALNGYAQFVLECQDSGIGMSEETMKKIFEPFYRASDSSGDKIEGTGLGLPIVKNISRMMNGDVCVESEIGKGSKFTVTLYHKIHEKEKKEDAAYAHDTGEKHIQMTLADMDYSEYRILIVEDNVLNREIACEIFGTSGVRIDATVNGKKALELLEERPAGYYDLVFMDIQMPVMDGYEATQKIRTSAREDIRNIPIIAMTADAFVEDVQRVKKAGMNDHIAKPIEIHRVGAIFEKWLKGKAGVL